MNRDATAFVFAPELGLNYSFSSDDAAKSSSPRLALSLRVRTPLLFEGPILVLADERIPVGRPLLHTALSLELEY